MERRLPRTHPLRISGGLRCDCPGLPLDADNAAPLEFVNLRGNKVTDIEGLSNVPTLKWLEIESEGLQTLGITGLRVVDAPSEHCSVDPQEAFQDLDHADSFGKKISVSSETSVLAEMRPERVTGTFAFNRVLTGSYDLYLTWPANIANVTDAATVKVTQSGEPLWSWSAVISGKTHEGLEFAKSENELIEKLKAKGGSMVKVSEAQFPVNQSHVPQERPLLAFSFDTPSRPSGWLRVGQTIGIEGVKHSVNIEVKVASPSTKSLALDAACLIPTTPWSMHQDKDWIWFRREQPPSRMSPMLPVLLK